MPDLSLYLVTDAGQCGRRGRTVVETALEAVAGGVTAIQVREKHAEPREVLDLLTALGLRLPGHVSLFVNDHAELFREARSLGIPVTGVHVGQRDLPVEAVREITGPDAVIGLTASTPEELSAAVRSTARVGYLGIGTVRQTSSKADAPAPIGVAGVAQLARSSALPAVAIGGVVPADLPALRAGGLVGAAVVSWVCDSPAPRAAAAALAGAWKVAA